MCKLRTGAMKLLAIQFQRASDRDELDMVLYPGIYCCRNLGVLTLCSVFLKPSTMGSRNFITIATSMRN